jgi:hypothetical protein
MSKSEHIEIGDEMLLDFKLEGEWTKEKLYETLANEIAAIAGGAAELSKNREKFYLKIKGFVDKEIVPEEMACLACPKRSSHRKYDDYNGLRDIKQPVLVLVSDFVDFREYSIMCSYYTDMGDGSEYDKNIELWADKTNFLRWLKKKTGFCA